eukprot:comp21621_c0_seq1/m.47695 comp21621_c0_seq1/g.47695  ORF comp21621_c0_seq1/g.47695 comp21621_c0_seq1/m.47695 type:complete len:338 (+) comp21621_c0_seq1:1088-2101(+)
MDAGREIWVADRVPFGDEFVQARESGFLALDIPEVLEEGKADRGRVRKEFVLWERVRIAAKEREDGALGKQRAVVFAAERGEFEPHGLILLRRKHKRLHCENALPHFNFLRAAHQPGFPHLANERTCVLGIGLIHVDTTFLVFDDLFEFGELLHGDHNTVCSRVRLAHERRELDIEKAAGLVDQSARGLELALMERKHTAEEGARDRRLVDCGDIGLHFAPAAKMPCGLGGLGCHCAPCGVLGRGPCLDCKLRELLPAPKGGETAGAAEGELDLERILGLLFLVSAQGIFPSAQLFVPRLLELDLPGLVLLGIGENTDCGLGLLELVVDRDESLDCG